MNFEHGRHLHETAEARARMRPAKAREVAPGASPKPIPVHGVTRPEAPAEDWAKRAALAGFDPPMAFTLYEIRNLPEVTR